MYKLTQFDIRIGFKCMYNIQLNILNEMKSMNEKCGNYQRDKCKWELNSCFKPEMSLNIRGWKFGL